MNTKRTIAAAALAAALAFGTVPVAFAADGDAEVGAQTPVNNADGKATGSTTISIQTMASNISATVPITVKVVGPADGGALTGVPNNYSIVNNSAYPIKVSKVEGVPAASGDWALSENPIAQGTAGTAKIGDLNLTLQIAGAAAPLTLKAAVQEPDDWKVAAKTGADGTVGAITIAGSISAVKSVSTTATTAVEVKYTIEATTTA